MHFAPVSHKFFILVDNQSWRKVKHSRSTRIKAFMTTKVRFLTSVLVFSCSFDIILIESFNSYYFLPRLQYRTSPFRNTRPLLRSSSFCLSSSSNEAKSLFKWFPSFYMASWREKAPFSVVNLYKELHGFIVFQVSWKDVRGINYLNELQVCVLKATTYLHYYRSQVYCE